MLTFVLAVASYEWKIRLEMVNNAGMDVVSRLEDLADLHLFRQVIEVNFYGTVYCTYYALPSLKETSSRIVNVSSLGGMLAIPFNTSYVASRFAMIGFSDSLRMELTETGVSVTVICPTIIALTRVAITTLHCILSMAELDVLTVVREKETKNHDHRNECFIGR